MLVKYCFKINMINKNYIYIGIALIIVVVAAVLLTNNGSSPDNDLQILASTSPTPTIEPSPTPVETPKLQPKKSLKPTPELIVSGFVTYGQLAEQFQEEGRRFVVNDACNEIVPSNLTLPNNIQVMFDNSASSIRHVIKIGGKEYLLEAGEWFLTILSSPTLPVRWPIFCGNIELGEIELVK